MTFSLKSTVGATDANSYVSIAEADDEFAGNYSSFEKWDALDTAEKERLLVQATAFLETWILNGLPATTTQALEWPRKYLLDRYGNTISSSVIPKQMKAAVCMMAEWILTEVDRLLPDITTQQYDTFNAGPLNLKLKANPQLLPLGLTDIVASVSPGIIISTTAGAPKPARFVR